jgi:adenine-specific DNA methylase
MQLSTMPKPKIDYRLSQMIVQCNQLIRLAETECDISLMINAMITQKALLQQAIEESVK